MRRWAEQQVSLPAKSLEVVYPRKHEARINSEAGVRSATRKGLLGTESGGIGGLGHCNNGHNPSGDEEEEASVRTDGAGDGGHKGRERSGFIAHRGG